jgi:hypothetical protein
MSTSVCSDLGLGQLNIKPKGFETANDWIDFMMILNPGNLGAYSRAISNVKKLSRTIKVGSGLNFGYFDGLTAGHQRVRLVFVDAIILLVAIGGHCISSGCPDCIYKLNPMVGFGTDTNVIGNCSARVCKAQPQPKLSLLVVRKP